MSIQMKYKHHLVLPDGTMQAIEWQPVGEGELIGSAEMGITDEPTGKFVIAWIEEMPTVGGPIDRRYHLEKF